jgi:urease accessory protein
MWWRCAPPVVLRPTGARRAHLVQAAGGPLGGDDLALDVHLGVGSSLQLRSTAAMVVQAGYPPAPARWTVTAELAVGAVLHWCPEPTVLCDGAELHSRVRVALQRGACALLREEVVLGRAGQRGGRFTGELAVELDGTPLLAHTLLLDGADPVLAGPAGTGGARVVGMLAVVGEGTGDPPQGVGAQPGLRWACSALDGPGWLLLALGDSPAGVSVFLDEAAREICAAGPRRC